MFAESINAGIELADELREIAQALVDRDLSTEQIRAAHEHARALARELEGSLRKCWY